MAAHADEIPALATRVGDLLYALLDGDTRSVSIVHARPGHSAETRIADRNLLPFDFGRFAPSGSRQPPLFNLPPARLLTRLSEEYVFAELCEALMLSYAAENEARMRAMIAARGNVEQRLDTLTADARRLRQKPSPAKSPSSPLLHNKSEDHAAAAPQAAQDFAATIDKPKKKAGRRPGLFAIRLGPA
jgi:F-type H+-transporting ATPase subunit gamma